MLVVDRSGVIPLPELPKDLDAGFGMVVDLRALM